MLIIKTKTSPKAGMNVVYLDTWCWVYSTKNHWTLLQNLARLSPCKQRSFLWNLSKQMCLALSLSVDCIAEILFEM